MATTTSYRMPSTRPSLYSRSRHAEVHSSQTPRLSNVATPLTFAHSGGHDSDSYSRQTPSRKRSRPNSPTLSSRSRSARDREDCYFTSSFKVPNVYNASAHSFDSAESPAVPTATSPLPFVNDRYEISGGLDTPSALSAARFEFGQSQPLTNFRTEWHEEQEPYHSYQRSSSNGKAQSWGQYVFGIINGSLSMAGKMIQFATTNAFNGFQAGGGQGYGIHNQDQNEIYERMESSVWEDSALQQSSTTPFEVLPSPGPGQYPSEDYEYSRAAKRQKPDDSRWVMVEDLNGIANGNVSSKLSTANPVVRSPGSERRSLIPRPSASRVSSRRSIAPTMVARRHSSTATHAGSPGAYNHGQGASTASPRAARLAQASPSERHTTSRPSTANGHYGREGSDVALSPEAVTYQARIAREEQMQDRSIRKMNARLKDMIREGQAALGAKVDIDEDTDTVVERTSTKRWR